MKLLKVLLLIHILLVYPVYSAEHHNEIFSLIPSLINFAIFATVVLYFGLPALNKYYRRHSVLFKQRVESTKIKSKEASMLLSSSKKKLLGFQQERKVMQENMLDDLKNFEIKIHQEMLTRKNKLKESTTVSLREEKKYLFEKHNKKLLQHFGEIALNRIHQDKRLQAAASAKLMDEITKMSIQK